jgi:hypothetical protein
MPIKFIDDTLHQHCWCYIVHGALPIIPKVAYRINWAVLTMNGNTEIIR